MIGDQDEILFKVRLAVPNFNFKKIPLKFHYNELHIDLNAYTNPQIDTDIQGIYTIKPYTTIYIDI